MIVYIKINNCFIYNNEVQFNLRADMRCKRFKSNIALNRGVLKSAIAFGPNNSGKTNLVKCIRAIKDIILNNAPSLLPNFYTDNSVCCLEVCFLNDDREYIFKLRYDTLKKEFLYEKLSFVEYDKYNNSKEVIIFVRDFEEQIFDCQDDDLKIVMKTTSKNNILIYLIDIEQFAILKNAKNILTVFANKIDIIDMNEIPYKKTLEMMKLSNETQKKIVNFIRNADVSLDDFKYISDDELSTHLKIKNSDSDNIQENIMKIPNNLRERLHLVSVYKDLVLPSAIFDSMGTRKIIALAGYVIDSLEKGRILVVDELDNSLHFKLTRAIISLYNNELNKFAQLICTVHDVTLLDCKKMFRKEQIWFSYKDRDNAYLYSLSEFTACKDGIRGDEEDLVEKYKKGIFGALPDPDLFQTLLEVQNNE